MTDLPPPPGTGGFPPPPPPSVPPSWGQPSPPPGAPGTPPWGQPPPPFGGAPAYTAPPGYQPQLANFGERLLAQLLDWLILFIAPTIIFVLGTVIIVTGPSHVGLCSHTDYYGDEYSTYQEPCDIPDGNTVAAGVLVYSLGTAVLVVEYVYYYRREGRTGLTWGRKAMGIRLVGMQTGQPIGSWQAFGRGLFAGFISGSVCYLGYLWMLWDSKRQTWQDKVVDSLVIKG